METKAGSELRQERALLFTEDGDPGVGWEEVVRAHKLQCSL